MNRFLLTTIALSLSSPFNLGLATSTPGTQVQAQFEQVEVRGQTLPGATQASFTVTPTSGQVPLTVAFDASASVGENLSYQWDFGDGNTGTGQQVSHTYGFAGTYFPVLTMSDESDSSATSEPLLVNSQVPVGKEPPVNYDDPESVREHTVWQIEKLAAENGLLKLLEMVPVEEVADIPSFTPDRTAAIYQKRTFDFGGTIIGEAKNYVFVDLMTRRKVALGRPDGIVIDRPVLSNDGKRVAFRSVYSSGSGIYVMDIGSLQPSLVVDMLEIETPDGLQPYVPHLLTFSPDNKQIGFFADSPARCALSSDPDCEEAADYVLIADVNKTSSMTETKQVTEGRMALPKILRWVGDSLVWMYSDPDDPVSKQQRLRQLTTTSLKARGLGRLLGFVDPLEILKVESVTPDRSLVLYEKAGLWPDGTPNFPTDEHYLVDLATGRQRLLEVPENVNIERPTLSNDGSLVVFENLLDNDVYIMNTTELVPRLLVDLEEGYMMWLPTFKADGSELGFAAVGPDTFEASPLDSYIIRVKVDGRAVSMRATTIVATIGGKPQHLYWEGDELVWSFLPGGSWQSTSAPNNRAQALSERVELRLQTPPRETQASFTATPTTGQVPLTVAFDASASVGENLNYRWDFGDGGTGTGQRVSHTYEYAGTYFPVLTVLNGSENSTASEVVRIRAPNYGEAPPEELRTATTPEGREQYRLWWLNYNLSMRGLLGLLDHVDPEKILGPRAFTPDRKWVIYERLDFEASYSSTSLFSTDEFFLVNMETGSELAIGQPTGKPIESLALSRDASMVAFREQGGGNALYVMDTDDLQPKLLVSFINSYDKARNVSYYLGGFTFSPDGSKLGVFLQYATVGVHLPGDVYASASDVEQGLVLLTVNLDSRNSQIDLSDLARYEGFIEDIKFEAVGGPGDFGGMYWEGDELRWYLENHTTD